MNSNYGRNLNNFEFDLGLSKNRSGSLNDQKTNKTSSSYSSTQPKPNTAWQPNKPSWTHQPASRTQSTLPGSLDGPTSMVGDIMGKSWGSSAPSSTASGIGIVNKNPNLFGDLVGPALGQNKGSSNVPLKNAAPVPAQASSKSAFSVGPMADLLPKTSNSSKTSGNWGSSESLGSYTNAFNNNSNVGVSNNKSSKFGGPSLRNLGGSGVGGGMSSNKDPFGSLVDFSPNPAASMNSASKGNNKANSVDDISGEFQNSKSGTSSFSTNAFPASNNNSMGSSTGHFRKMDDFGIPTSHNQPPVVQSSAVDAFDVLFPTSSASAGAGAAAKGSEDLGSHQFSGADDWAVDSQFGGNEMGGTTELEGLPPPPAGVTASVAKNKGMDNHKQGQYADAIKWLSWAVILLEKSGDDAGTKEVLSSRASCYKEVGEYKKAVADCTKVLENDGTNVSVLVQRALLYESMEKYKLGAEDLRTVMKLDPGNRLARSTIHRLTKMAE